MEQLGPLIWPCLGKEREKEKRHEKEKKKKKREKTKKEEVEDDIRSLDGLKTERQSMQKLEESC